VATFKETAMKDFVLRIAAAATVVVLGASGASAATISFTYTGHGTSVTSGGATLDLSGQFSVGDLLTGTFIFDDAATLDGVIGTPGFSAFYESALQSLSGAVGSYIFSGNDATEIVDNLPEDGFSTFAGNFRFPNPRASSSSARASSARACAGGGSARPRCSVSELTAEAAENAE
jgi:hypothetical protein